MKRDALALSIHFISPLLSHFFSQPARQTETEVETEIIILKFILLDCGYTIVATIILA